MLMVFSKDDWREKGVESRNFSGFKNSCPPPQSDPDYACLGPGNAHGQGSKKRKGGLFAICLVAPPPHLSPLALTPLLPACPSGLLGRHHYCPQPASPDGSKRQLASRLCHQPTAHARL